MYDKRETFSRQTIIETIVNVRERIEGNFGKLSDAEQGLLYDIAYDLGFKKFECLLISGQIGRDFSNSVFELIRDAIHSQGRNVSADDRHGLNWVIRTISGDLGLGQAQVQEILGKSPHQPDPAEDEIPF